MKKFISLFLVFSVLALSIPLTAKERKGADLIIQKKESQQARGELIAVKENSLLLLERESGVDVSIEIDDVKVITFAKKSFPQTGLFIGLLIGTGVGATAGLLTYDLLLEENATPWWPIGLGLGGGFIGSIIGGIIEGISKGYETIQFEGKSEAEIREILEKLRKKARVRSSQ